MERYNRWFWLQSVKTEMELGLIFGTDSRIGTEIILIYNILGVCPSGRPPWGKGVRVSTPFVNAFPWCIYIYSPFRLSFYYSIFL